MSLLTLILSPPRVGTSLMDAPIFVFSL